MKLSLILSILLLVIGCSPPSEDAIEAAEYFYNQNFLASFDEAKALKEGCWKSDEWVYASYKNGKLDPSQYTSKNKHFVRLTTKRCVDDLEVRENEVILWDEQEDYSYKDSFPDNRFPSAILFSVDEDDDNLGYFIFIKINPFFVYLRDHRERWYDDENNATWWDKVKDKDLERWLNRETLTYHVKVENRFSDSGTSEYSRQYKIIEEKELKSLLKKTFIAIQQSEAQEEETRRNEEIEQKGKRKL